MKYVQINSFYNGSTGTIMRNLHRDLQEQGVDSYIFWGRRHESINEHEQCCASKLGVYSHGVRARLTGRAGFYSKRDTKNLLKRLDAIKPDIVHLHNIHGYYINVEMLFDWLYSHDCGVVWTLHDCWAFTGHCSHFEYIGCEKWKTLCAQCPQKNEYPKSLLLDQSTRNFIDKKRIFNQIPKDRMLVIVPSEWLANLLSMSFLSKYSTRVVRNKIDTNVFKATKSNFREHYGVGNRFMILGVANPWTARKGLNDFIRLAEKLDKKKYAVVLVGLSKKQLKKIPKEIIGLARTKSQAELAGIYSCANVFLNPTYEDNFPTVNLEAEACGTQVVTFDTGGCRETVTKPNSMVIEKGVDLYDVILNLSSE